MSATPAEWTLTELDEGTTTIGEAYWSTPQDLMLATLLKCWHQAEEIAAGTRRPELQARVSAIAGAYAFYLARLGFHAGDRNLAAGFGTIAEQYAEFADDPLLVGSVASLRACIAFNGGRFAEAARIARAALKADPDPYVLPRLAGYAARAEAAAGRHGVAREAFHVMLDAPVSSARRPGAGLFNSEERALWNALVAAELGEPEAIPAARDAIDGYRVDHVEGRGLAWCALAQALAPDDSAGAAYAATQGLTLSEAWPSTAVVALSARVHEALPSGRGAPAEVAELGRVVDMAKSRTSLV